MLKRLHITIEQIFLYQFVVYLLIWFWGVHTVITEGFQQRAIVYVAAPLIVLVGYVIDTRKSALLCAAGDLAMAYTVSRFSVLLFQERGYVLEVVLSGSLGLCMLVRFIRDLLVISTRKA
jgi:hypothetical protein